MMKDENEGNGPVKTLPALEKDDDPSKIASPVKQANGGKQESGHLHGGDLGETKNILYKRDDERAELVDLEAEDPVIQNVWETLTGSGEWGLPDPNSLFDDAVIGVESLSEIAADQLGPLSDVVSQFADTINSEIASQALAAASDNAQ